MSRRGCVLEIVFFRGMHAVDDVDVLVLEGLVAYNAHLMAVAMCIMYKYMWIKIVLHPIYAQLVGGQRVCVKGAKRNIARAHRQTLKQIRPHKRF